MIVCHNYRKRHLDNVVEIKDLKKTFKSFFGKHRVDAVKGITFNVHEGEIFGLLGPNGSGKTTTIKLLLGLLFPTSGSISLMNHSASSMKSHKFIGYLPEESYLYRFLNADEILHFYGKLFSISRNDRKKKIDELISLVGLEKSRKRQLKGYSKGMMRRIGIAQALINDPEFIILDEPTSGLDPIGTREVKDLIMMLKDKGKTVLLCSHLLADVEDVCNRIAIMYEGSLECLGEVSELLTDLDSCDIVLNKYDEKLNKRILAMAKEENITCEISSPRRKLEDLFLEIVNKNKNQ
ncbi:MAG: multidrug ABC transporter ATP-binding protein [Planctomycetota bacterium]|nr:MAG: multidrug ABC transporter ATP-binding protein [Planctomycetota bacterium]